MNSTLKLGKRKNIEFVSGYSIGVSNIHSYTSASITFYPKDHSELGRIRTEMTIQEFESFVKSANNMLEEAKKY